MSPPGMAAAGFVLWSCHAASRPCTARRGRGARRRSSASWTGSALARHAGAMVPAGAGSGPHTWRGTRFVAVPGQGRSSPRRWSTISCRTAATRCCSGTRRNWARYASPAMTPRPRARAAGADAADRPRAPGGGHLSTRSAGRDRAGRALCMPAKFGRGVSGRSAAESLDSARKSTSIRGLFVRF